MSDDLPIKPNIAVGEQLKTRRKQLKLSLSQIETETKIRGKYLSALEACDYDALPNDIYSRGFVQHYASHLGMDGQLMAAAYVAERGGLEEGKTNRPKLQQSKRLVFTGPLLALLAGFVAIAGIVAYLVWQFSALAAAPHLSIASPETDQSLTGSLIDVAGDATPGSEVSVNDSPVLTDTNGNFSEKVVLRDGVNAIRVTARSKLGKTTTVTRNILAKLPVLDQAATSVPATTIDGVTIAVSVKQTTSLVVIADGKEVWRGTLLAGGSKLFGGPGVSDIQLTTGNAGATSVVVTNTVVAAKKIDKLGDDGEIRRNQDFAKTTSF